MLVLVIVPALTGMSLSPWTWYLTRASGFALYVLVWLATVLGLGLTTTLLDRFGGRAVLFSVHAYATELAYGFLALHLLTLAADQAVPFGFADLVAPFASPWREPWTGLGVLAAELLVLIGASFAVRWLIGFRGWRLVHWLTFPLYGLGLAHGLGAGTDRSEGWAQGIYLITALCVVWLASYRVLRRGARVIPPQPPSQPAPLDRLATPAIASKPHRSTPVSDPHWHAR
jgi:sulfoxide reductase heme-binding subunit YedZ